VTTYIHQPLVSDGSLILSMEEALRVFAWQWMPRIQYETSTSHPSGPSIRLIRGRLDRPNIISSPILELGRVGAWREEGRDRLWLENEWRTILSIVDLGARVADVAINNFHPGVDRDITSVLTIVAGMLLVRDGKSPVHAGGVVDDSGRAWLLVGDSHSGKSTTTANLIRAGWSYLSDDYVVMLRDGGTIKVEGWPDDFHLDEGWKRGESTGVRETVSESDVGEGKRVTTALLGGLLFPRVDANAETRVASISPATALERLIRQSPWLIADESSAAKVFDLFAQAASLPAAELRVGLDTFAKPELLSQIVKDFTEAKREPGAQ